MKGQTKDPCKNESIAPRAAMCSSHKARGGTPTAGVLEVHRGRRGPRNAEDGDAATLECTTHSCTGPKQLRSSARACGKAILFGEHFVLYGGTAIALPVPTASLEVELQAGLRRRHRILCDCPTGDLHTMARAVRRGLAELAPGQRYTISLTSRANFPGGAGLGASAAFSVAFGRAFLALHGAVDEDRVAQAAHEMEQLFHRHASGIDATTVAFGEPCFVKTGSDWLGSKPGGPAAGFLDLAPGACFLLADSGERRATGEAVARVTSLVRRRSGAALMGRLVEVAETIALQGATAMRNGDFGYVGTMMNENHYLLGALGLSTERLDHLRATALDNGALGAKLTGAGCGGFLLGLAYPDALAELRTALTRAGVTTFFEVDSGLPEKG